ncbi:hypothetical protein SNE40_010731 [Patella caerulea]|uniref:Uncharacterized protein n=1 Tax=Patella caerulea TaxID=87958 RepID=A0AAN8JVN8_PATCE
MPGGKKRKLVNPAAEPGIARTYLDENFSDLPVVGNDLKNGHVLYIYITAGNKSRTETERFLKRHLPEVNNTFRSSSKLNSNIKSLVNQTLIKLKKLSVPEEFQAFSSSCSQRFYLHVDTQCVSPVVVSTDPPALDQVDENTNSSTTTCTSDSHLSAPPLTPLVSSADIHVPTPDPSLLTPPVTEVTASPPPHPSREVITPRKQKLKKRLKFVSASKSEQKERFSKKIKIMKQEIDKHKHIKIKQLNQQLKRKTKSIENKNEIIRDLQRKLKKTNTVNTSLNEENMKRLKRTHERLRKANKVRRTGVAYSSYSLEQYNQLKIKLNEKDRLIRTLENEKLELEDIVCELKKKNPVVETKKDGKTYSVDTRMEVFDFLVNKVPTENVSKLMTKIAERSGGTLSDIPNRTTVEQMARELGIIADLQSSEVAMKTKNITLGFDATTQEGIHINSIHITTKDETNVIAVDELPGGTTEDYHNHVCDSVDHLAYVYADFHEEEFQHCRTVIINNISNTMTDRAAVNHSTIQKLGETWGKSLNELNCNLHPLDTIATTCRSALKSLETQRGTLYGKDCIAGNVVLQINKFRYKDGKGDPKGFTTFLRDHGLPRGLIPRYRGNRLHILFHICGKLIEHHPTLLDFFTSGTVSCGGLQTSLKTDFKNDVAVLEMQVLGVLGKTLTGPWMKKFYTAAGVQVDHMEAIEIVQGIIKELKLCSADPLSILSRTCDFFGHGLSEEDATLQKLSIPPSQENKPLFSDMVITCISGVISVLERQYKRYFELDVTEQLKKETQSARAHNIDAEEMIGMFGAWKQRAQNATTSFLSARLRAKKNRVVPYLDGIYKSKQECIVKWAIGMARKKRNRDRKKQVDISKELSRRAAAKVQKKQERNKKDLEKKLMATDITDINTEFPDLEETCVVNLTDILSGKVVGRDICHMWYDNDTQEKTVYSGRIEKLKKKQGQIYYYRIGYWEKEESYEDAVDYDITKYALAADFIDGDLILC